MLFALAADAIGRVDQSMLTDQEVMEIFLGSCDDNSLKNFQENGEYLPVCEWSGVRCENRRVIEIHMEFFDLVNASGPLQFGLLPHRLRELSLRGEGNKRVQIFAEKLPRTLMYWFMSHCSVEGSFAVDALPESIDNFTMCECKFEVSVDLSAFPNSIVHLSMQYCELGGSIETALLPRSAYSISLYGNALLGSIDLAKLHTEVRSFDASTNRLTGSIDLLLLPPHLEHLALKQNSLEGTIDLSALPESLICLELGENKLTGSVDLSQLGSLCLLDINTNNFYGKLNLTSVPGETRVEFLGCKFTKIV